MPTTITDRLRIVEDATAPNEHVIIKPGVIARNGVDIVGGESPPLPKVVGNHPTDLEYKINEIIDLLYRGGFAREP
jgi:hypothetical protein